MRSPEGGVARRPGSRLAGDGANARGARRYRSAPTRQCTSPPIHGTRPDDRVCKLPDPRRRVRVVVLTHTLIDHVAMLRMMTRRRTDSNQAKPGLGIRDAKLARSRAVRTPGVR